MAEFERVASVEELPADGRLSVFVDDVPVLLVRVGEQVFAIEDVCSHDSQPLTTGTVSQGQIACPRHGARFDLATGKAMCMPATSGIQVYDVEIRGHEILCRINDGTATPAATVSTLVAMPVLHSTGSCCSTTPTEPAAAHSGEHCSAEMVSATVNSSERTLDEKMIDALKTVIDPELFVNVVDLGLVYSINYDGAKAYVDMTLTSPMCPAGPQIVQQAKMALERLREVDEAVIKIVMSPPWTPERMTDEARDHLGIF